MIRTGKSYSPMGRLALTSLALATVAVPALLNAARAQGAGQTQVQDIHGTLIDADEVSFDFKDNQYVLTGDVKLRTSDSHLTAQKMTVQRNKAQELEWAKCEGDVYLERKSAQDGTLMTAKGRTLDYYEQKQLAYLKGGILVTQTSPRLLKPAEITGDHVDLNLQTKVNVVHGAGGKQAKVHIEPKGNPSAAGADKKPDTPEPADLIGDQIQMNGETQEYVASGSPRMARPTSNLTAKTIRFQVDNATNDVKVAYAEKDVVYDGKSDQGSIIHATGDNGVFNKATNELVLEGNFHATIKNPEDEAPQVFQGKRFTYNTQSSNYKLERDKNGPQASVVLPARPNQGEKPGAKPGEKPAKPAAPVTPATEAKKSQ